MCFSLFPLYWIRWISSICGFLIFIKFGKNVAIISWNICCPLSFFVMFRIPITYMWDCLRVLVLYFLVIYFSHSTLYILEIFYCCFPGHWCFFPQDVICSQSKLVYFSSILFLIFRSFIWVLSFIYLIMVMPSSTSWIWNIFVIAIFSILIC